MWSNVDNIQFTILAGHGDNLRKDSRMREMREAWVTFRGAIQK